MSIFRHPLVVGGLLAALSALLASLILPGLTRVWQDRPKELALKNALVQRISEASADTIDNARYFGFAKRYKTIRPGQETAFYNRVDNKWLTQSSIIHSQLMVYFAGTTLPGEWSAYNSAVLTYLDDQLSGGGPLTSTLREHFREVHLDDPRLDVLRAHFVRSRSKGYDRFLLPRLLFAERDHIETELVASNASGFSHGFWIFR